MDKEHLHYQVRQCLLHHQLFSPQALLVVAVSGGPDSLCLLHLLWQIQQAGGPTLHVAHLDHMFRGEESAAEARFVQHIANEWNIPATIMQYDVPAYIEATGENKQTAARTIRYAFLGQVAQNLDANAVVVAHHADDQAETVLLHLLHGAGLSGLRGMRSLVPWKEWHTHMPAKHMPIAEIQTQATPALIRPLIEIRREEIEAYCNHHHLTPQNDPSNESRTYTRNRIRAELLPHMTHYNPHIVAALGRTARICADDYAYMQQQLDAVWTKRFVETQPNAIRFNKRIWQTLPVSLQRYALRRAVVQLIGTEELSYDVVESAREVVQYPTGAQCSLMKHMFLRVEYETFAIVHTTTHTSQTSNPLLSLTDQELPQLEDDMVILTIPGTTPISSQWQVQCSFTQPERLPQDERYRWWVSLDTDAIQGPLMLRKRKTRDRFRPANGRGSRSLQDFFVDQKVPRMLRADWPILATPKSVVWVAGFRADERFHATAKTSDKMWIVLVAADTILSQT